MDLRFAKDQPLEMLDQDLLDRKPFVKRVLGALTNCETPYVFGFLGDWGSGKTSVMHFLEWELLKNLASSPCQNESRPLLIPIWFNPWLYEKETNMVYPLLHAVAKAYEALCPKPSQAFGNRLKKLALASLHGSLDLALRGITKSVTGNALKLENIEKTLAQLEQAFDPAWRQWSDRVKGLQEDFTTLINQFAEDYLARLGAPRAGGQATEVKFVIFIDDLDRCLPATALEILENIKNFLIGDRVIYLLGINPRIVRQAVGVKYQGLEVEGARYLEKMINYSFQIPIPSEDSIKELVVKNCLPLHDEGESGMKERIQQAGSHLAAAQFNNPRMVKRILNRYLQFLNDFEDNMMAYDHRTVLSLLVLAEYEPDIFAAVRRHKSGLWDYLVTNKAAISQNPLEDKLGCGLGTEQWGRYLRHPALYRGPDQGNLDAHIGAVLQIHGTPQ